MSDVLWSMRLPRCARSDTRGWWRMARVTGLPRCARNDDLLGWVGSRESGNDGGEGMVTSGGECGGPLFDEIATLRSQ